MKVAFTSSALTPSVAPYVQKFRLLNMAHKVFGLSLQLHFLYLKFYSSGPMARHPLHTHSCLLFLGRCLARPFCLCWLSSNHHLADVFSSFKIPFRCHLFQKALLDSLLPTVG